MARTLILVLITLLAVSCATSPQTTADADQTALIADRVDISRFNGKNVGSLSPRLTAPDLQNGPFVTAWFTGKEVGKTKEGDWVVGIRFVGWRNNKNSALVSAYALISTDPASQQNVGAVPIGTYEVHAGQSVRVMTMEELGMAPMVLRGVARVEG